MRLQAYENALIYKARTKLYHDRFNAGKNQIVLREFYAGQPVLFFNFKLKLFSGKLKSKWSGPFIVKNVPILKLLR